MVIPTDSHVTEHVDHTGWEVLDPERPENAYLVSLVGPDGLLAPPSLDRDGYLAGVQRCRYLFPELVIITGVELGEPHWYPRQTADYPLRAWPSGSAPVDVYAYEERFRRVPLTRDRLRSAPRR